MAARRRDDPTGHPGVRSLAFWIGQAALFGWAVAERLGVAPTLTAWDILVVVMGLYLVCSATVGLRRGLN
ncbi:hypothetical protein [Brevundimonas abyssalis]|uniref:Uncharacterized protein n=1 Tax=Brevundimonas abyssalis TAR-001 TaxID=1391729 RepID=A0A8E0KK50_9CAUL|nr:hypothetical protein [Brevundimonas abyssalis]GAD58089.1 hypothetical protein MBEBAB_0339 [Brevundimonas abyssalis TAR-001]